MMSDDAGINPYEPPKAEIHAQVKLKEKRPKSTKVIIGFLTIAILGWILMYNDAIQKFGWQAVIDRQSLFDPVILGVVMWIFFVIGRPRLLIYGLGSCWLVMVIALNAWSLVSNSSHAAPDKIQFAINVMMLTLMIWLFYRFTFGLPSRRYYGIGSAKNETE